MKSFLVASKTKEVGYSLFSSFRSEYDIEIATGLQESFDCLHNKRFDYFFIDIDLFKSNNTGNYKEILKKVWNIFPTMEIIIICPQSLIGDAVKAVKFGASEYIIFPFTKHEVELCLESIDENTRLQSELDYLRDKFWQKESLAILQTNSDSMKIVFDKVRAVSQTETTVLLTGETGVGKGVIANLIHQNSYRRNNQFISVHCGAIPENLLESELFGHEKGAFTGAIKRRLGKFEIADGGVIFLDEIGTISNAMQIKLLQVLQEKTFERVGGESQIEVDVRIIAATNSDLLKMCNDGSFRPDLYYRLNVFPIDIPPLRERIDDIPLLINKFIKKLNRYHAKHIKGIDPFVLNALLAYSWPGNIRELENIIERAYILEKTEILGRKSFPQDLFKENKPYREFLTDTSITLKQGRQIVCERYEKEYLEQLLIKFNGRIDKTAQAAGLGVRQLNNLMAKYNLQKNYYKN